MISNEALSEAQFQRLDDFLMSDDAPDDTMDTAMLDGYLAAIASGPNLIMPSDTLRWVWDTEKGEDAPEFKSAQEAQEIIGLVMQHYQNVNDTLNRFPQDYEPRIMEREQEGRVIPIIDEWCMGYYKGMALDLQAWSPLMLSQLELFSTILLHGTDEGWETLKSEETDLDRHQARADSLADSARQIHAFWLAQRQEQVARGEPPGVVRRQQPMRSGPKVGRNDACPCGSGRKYKHCHGAN